jgi:predicted RNA-binding protein YlxR (DUF448 family)
MRLCVATNRREKQEKMFRVGKTGVSLQCQKQKESFIGLDI